MTDEITLEERLAKELAGRLLGYTEGSADDIANVKDSLEDALKAADVRLCKPIKASVYVAPDTGELPKFLEEMFKTSQPIGRITDEDDEDEDDCDDEDEDDCDDEALAELEHMRSVADMAYMALSDLAWHLHARRDDTSWTQATDAEKAHRIALLIDERIEGLED